MSIRLRHSVSRVLLGCLLGLAGAATPGCGGPDRREHEPWQDSQRAEFEQRSEILARAFDEIVDDHLAGQAESHTDSDREQVHERVLEAVPGLLRTTERVERAFAAGDFPNAGNQQRVDRLLERMRLLDVRLPALTRMLVDEHRRGELRDARLEILRRLLEHHDRSIGDQLWPS